MDIVERSNVVGQSFRSIFPKKAPFAFQPIVMNFDTDPKLNDYFYATVPNHGRRIMRAWLDLGGYTLDTLEVLINGVLIYSWTGEYIAINTALRTPSSKQIPSQLLLPLPRYFPVVPGTVFRIRVPGVVSPAGYPFKLMADWVYDTLPVDGDYLIEQVQLQVCEQSTRLLFRNVIKELIVVVQDQDQGPLQFTDQISNMTLTFNGVPKVSDNGAYFKYIQPMMYHTSNRLGVYTYSFALKPEDELPTGGVNMSRIHNVTLNVTPMDSLPKNIRVYAISYNALRVQGSNAAVLYDNL